MATRRQLNARTTSMETTNLNQLPLATQAVRHRRVRRPVPLQPPSPSLCIPRPRPACRRVGSSPHLPPASRTNPLKRRAAGGADDRAAVVPGCSRLLPELMPVLPLLPYYRYYRIATTTVLLLLPSRIYAWTSRRGHDPHAAGRHAVPPCSPCPPFLPPSFPPFGIVWAGIYNPAPSSSGALMNAYKHARMAVPHFTPTATTAPRAEAPTRHAYLRRVIHPLPKLTC